MKGHKCPVPEVGINCKYAGDTYQVPWDNQTRLLCKKKNAGIDWKIKHCWEPAGINCDLAKPIGEEVNNDNSSMGNQARVSEELGS